MYVYKKKILLAIFTIFDLIGSLITAPARSLRGKKLIPPSRILVMRLDHIGDVVMATSVLEPLRSRFPEAVITFMGPPIFEGIFETAPVIDGFIGFEAPWFARERRPIGEHLRSFLRLIKAIRAGKYDTVIDLRGDVRHIAASFFGGAKNRISYGITGGGYLLTHNVPYIRDKHEIDKDLMLLMPLGIACSKGDPKLYYTKGDEEQASILKEEEGIGDRYAVLHIIPGSDSKKWSDESIIAVIEHLSRKNVQTVIVGSEREKEHVEKIIREAGKENIVNISGKTELGVLVRVLAGSIFFIGPDSGPAHIAAAEHVPCLVLFSGINDPYQWAPRGNQVKVIAPEKGERMDSIDVKEVCGYIDEVFGRHGGDTFPAGV